MSQNDQQDPRTQDEHPAEQLDAAEEVGPEGCNPPPSEVETEPVVLDRNEPQDCEFDARREITEQFSPESEVMVPHPFDGLPVPSHELGGTTLPLDPTFSYDHVCVEDDRQWVEVFADEAYSSWTETRDPTYVRVRDVGSYPVLCRRQWEADGTERARETFTAKQVVRRFGQTFVRAGDAGLTPVRPLRPKCIHYKRQLFNTDGMDPNELGGKTRFDNCTHPARRSIGGASMSLRGQVVYACDYRSPTDVPTVERHLDAHDQERLATKPELVPLFGMEPSTTSGG